MNQGNLHRLERARASMLERAGGTVSVSEAAELLGLSATAVQEGIDQGTLLAVEVGPDGELRLPRAQFSDSGLLPGLHRVLEAMHVADQWMRLQLFLDADVLPNLRNGRVDRAVAAADSYLPKR